MKYLKTYKNLIENLQNNFIVNTFNDEDEYFNMQEISKQCYKLAKDNNLHIYSNKEISGFILNDIDKVIGCIFTSQINEIFSFDYVVDEKYRKLGLGKKLIKFALDEFNDYREGFENAYIELDVINDISKNILLKFGFEIESKIGNQRYIMTKYKDKNIFENQTYDHKQYLLWKHKNVTLRGMKEIGKDNEIYPSLGKGLYTVPLSNSKMAKSYGKLYFVLNAIPKNPKIFNGLNDWEIFFQNKLIYPYSKLKGNEYPDKRDFEQNTTIENEMIKMGFDGIIIKSREMVNFNPKDIMYFENENQLINYYINNYS